MGATADDVQSMVNPEDLQSALDAARDPDTIPAGGVQATTTEEAKAQARNLLARLPRTDAESASLRKDIEASAEASKNALRRAQQFLMQNPGLYFPSQAEMANRQAAALMHPNPGVGMAGAAGAQFGNLAAEKAAEAEAMRTGLISAAQSGIPIEEQVGKINETMNAARQKLLDMQTKQNTELARSAMTQLGRVAASPAANKRNLPQSNPGKIAMDELGPDAFMEDGVTFSPAYHQRVKEIEAANLAAQGARAGTDERPLTPEETADNANEVGVPAAPVGLPDYSRMSTPQRKQALQTENKMAEKEFEAYPEMDAQTQAALRGLDEFQSLNKVTHTGPDTQPFTLGGAHAGPHGVGVDLSQEHGGLDLNPVSWFNKFNSNFQTMNKLAANIVSTAIPAKGFGRVTNRDLNLFQQGSIGTDKAQATNDAIAQALRIRLQNDLDMHRFRNAYFGVHQSLKGADNAWQDYLNNNPIFDPNDPKQGVAGHYSLNPHRQGWQDYFRRKNSALESAPVENLEGHRQRLVDPVQGPRTSPAEIAEDNLPAIEHHAEGGEVGADQGESPDALRALLNGLTLKAAPQAEDPNSPATNFGGELLGGGALTAAALMALRRPQRLAELMERHPGLAASGIGALTGGIAGGISADEPGTYAGVGAVLGSPLRMAGSGAYERLARLADRVTGNSLTPGVRKAVDALNADTGGNFGQISSTLLKDRAMGVPSTVAEAAGPRSTGLAVAAMNKDTPESAALLKTLQDRQAGAPERAYDITNNALAPDNYMAKTKELTDALYSKAAPLYEQAFAQFPSVKSQALMEIMSTPSGQEAASRAFRMMQDQRMPIGQPDAAGMIQNPSLQYLDQVKRSLDDMILREEGSGPTYQATQQGRVLRKMRSDLVNELDSATAGANGVSPYREARNQYAGDLDVLDSLRAGREMFPKQTADEVRDTISKLDYSSRDAYRSGVAEGIFQQIQGLGPNRNAAQAVIANPKLQEKIAAIFDNPAQAQRFIQSLQREAAIFQSGKALTASGLKGQITSMQPRSVSTMLRHSLMTKNTAGDVASTLGTQSTDPDVKDKIARLRNIADSLRARAGHANFAGTTLAGAAPIAASPSPQEQQ